VKILFVITKSEPGGAQTHVWQLSSYLQQRGHSVHITASPGGWLEERAIALGMPFHPNAALSNSFNPLRGMRAARTIVGLVGEIRPDVIHCHSSAAGFWARIAIKGATPTLFTAHGWGFAPGAPRTRGLVLLAAEKLVSRFTSSYICVSEFDRHTVLRYRIGSASKVIVIHNGIEAQDYARRPTSEKSLRAVFVGRLSRQKDPELLVRAIGELPARARDAFDVQIIGDGPLLPELQRLIRELGVNIELAGAMPREAVMQALSKAHLFVLTSRYEGFPISILEAMSMGLAVIASDVGGVREAITPECGILIRRGDKEALKRALLRLAEDREAIDRYGAAAWERARREFSVTAMCEKTLAVYESVLAR
jgi:glycosyltransferase involved in cell wall biosynthesis